MSEKKDQLKEILKDQLNREAKQIEEEVGLNDNEEIPDELKLRMKNALDQKIREREKRSEDTKRTDAYAKLSEEDREALRIGREMLKNQSEEKKIYTMRRKKRNIRRIVALAAVLILVMAVGMTSFGGPERMLQFMKSSVGGRQVSKVNSSDKNKIIEEEDEELAYEDAEKEFGIGVVRILGKLDEMQFDKMILDRDLQVAELSYKYKDGKIQFIISAAYGETAWGSDNEDIVIDNYFIKRKETTIEVKKYKMSEKSKDRFAAEFEYKDLHYCITGTINEIEIKKILDNLYFM
jgi:Icc-related predicted phosphoesterase